MSRPLDLLNAPIRQTLVSMTVPMMFGIVSLMLFNLADIWFVAQLGTAPMAALAFTFPVSFSVVSLAIGLGVGTSATLARLIGSGNGSEQQAARLATDNLLLTVLLLTVVGITGQHFADPIFRLMGADPELLPLIDAYMEVWFAGSVFLVLNMVCNSTFRASGDTRLSAAVMLISSLINIILDPLLIFGWGPVPAMGIRGAALASVLAWSITTLLALHLLYHRKGMLVLAWPEPRLMLNNWRKVLSISLPAALSNMMTPLANGILTALVAVHGAEAVAAFGAGARIESLSLLVCLALSMTLPPFISQNYGALKVERVKAAYRGAIRFALLWQLLIFGVLVLASGSIAQLFSDDPAVARWLQTWMLIVPAGFGFQAMTFLSASSFNALHQPMRAMRISLFRLFLMYVPLGWLGNQLFGLTGMFCALVVANAITAVVASSWVKRYLQALDTASNVLPASR
ncbi:MATE family efflux transporter [Marinobacterium marinum]|uniref:MATE family efflux transporter n=1 Tax=Marinobacterium marinum TaxID=2756129 RepID=A0A7W1WW56_9GAMM|nr:MATE family efflux transporter [Marinobacterium marinum]MBA4501325.1 MATE family efflux transporter [Marinobacterium marinum]